MNAKSNEALVSDQVAEAAHDTVERIAKSAAEAEERIRKAAVNAEKELQKSTGQVKDQTQALSESIVEYVNEHPIKSVGIAFAAGALVSALLRR